MEYKSHCCICGRQTKACDFIMDHCYVKSEAGFIEVQVKSGINSGQIRNINFCPSCAKKSYTIEELKTIGNYNQWSY